MRKKFARDFERLELLIKFTEKDLKRPSHRFSPEFNSLFYLSVLAFWVKAVKTARSIVLLCEGGFGSDANILMRTLIETTISGKYLCEDDQNERAIWYASFGAIKQKSMEGVLRKGRYKAVRNAIPKESSESLQEIYESVVHRRQSQITGWKRIKLNACLFLSRFGIKPDWWPWAATWSGRSLPRMAKVVGLPTFYDLPYRLASDIVHATDPTNHVELLDPKHEDPAKGVRFLIDPDEKHLDTALLTAALCFGDLLETVYRVLQMPRQDELQEICEKNRADVRTV